MQGEGFNVVQGLGSVKGSGFRVQGLGLRVKGSGQKVMKFLGFKLLGFSV